MGVVGCSVGIVLGVVCVALRRVSILVFVVHVASWVRSVHAAGFLTHRPEAQTRWQCLKINQFSDTKAD